MAAFQALRWSLAYIDVRLVQRPVGMFLAPGISSPSSGRGHGKAPSTEGAMVPDVVRDQWASLLGLRPRSAAAHSDTRLGASDVTETLEAPIGPGYRLGDFEIDRHLASGGMGAVYQAQDTVLGRPVALKVLPREFGSDSNRLKRFEQEAKVLARLNHPNIATLYAFGHEDGMSFLAMELVDGITLADRIAAGALLLDESLRVAIEITGALQQAHARGIVHRDLKPENIMLTESGSKLLDFGLATGFPFEIADSGDHVTVSVLTSQGEILGTLRYMSPEQLQSRGVDQRSDVFSFGAVLFEMVTGQKAFPGESQATIIGQILHTDPLDRPSLSPGLSPGLEDIVRRCLTKKPASRFQNMGELRAALRALQRDPDAVRSE